MKLKYFILFYIPYVFATNIGFSLLLRDWKYSMKTYTSIYIAIMNLPLIVYAIYFIFQKLINKSKSDLN